MGFFNGDGTFGPIGGAAGPSTSSSSPVFQIAREQAAPFWAQGGSPISSTSLVLIFVAIAALILLWKLV